LAVPRIRNLTATPEIRDRIYSSSNLAALPLEEPACNSRWKTLLVEIFSHLNDSLNGLRCHCVANPFGKAAALSPLTSDSDAMAL
jgi:hypothetical protein